MPNSFSIITYHKYINNVLSLLFSSNCVNSSRLTSSQVLRFFLTAFRLNSIYTQPILVVIILYSKYFSPKGIFLISETKKYHG